MTGSRRLSRWKIAAAVLCVLVLVGFGFRRSFLSAAGDYLDVGGAPVPADFVYLLGGDLHSRPAAAAELYKQGFAPRIVMSRVYDTPATQLGIFPNETDATRELFLVLGVPDSALVILSNVDGVASTTDEAVELRTYLQENPAEHILVLTSDYHTRRTRWNLRRQLSDTPVELTMIGAPDPRFSSSDWWRSEEGMILYFEEYLKFVHNFVYR